VKTESRTTLILAPPGVAGHTFATACVTALSRPFVDR
jgi:hypothetical protein